MTAGLNFERTLICAMTLGWQAELLRNAVPYAQRRVQFGKPTIDIPANQTKIADLIIRLRLIEDCRLLYGIPLGPGVGYHPGVKFDKGVLR